MEEVDFIKLREEVLPKIKEGNVCPYTYRAMYRADNFPAMVRVLRENMVYLLRTGSQWGVSYLKELYSRFRDEFNRNGFYMNEDAAAGTVLSTGSSHVKVSGSVELFALESSVYEAEGHVRVFATDSSKGTVTDRVRVNMDGDSVCTARGFSEISASGNSRVIADGAVTVWAGGNSEVTALCWKKITAFGNSRVQGPMRRNIEIKENSVLELMK